MTWQVTPDFYYFISSTIFGTLAALEAGGYNIESQKWSSLTPAHMYPNALPDLNKSKRPVLPAYPEMMDRSIRGHGSIDFEWVIPFQPYVVISGWKTTLGIGTYSAACSVETIAGEMKEFVSATGFIPWVAFNAVVQAPRIPYKDYIPERNGWRDVRWRFVDCVSIGSTFH